MNCLARHIAAAIIEAHPDVLLGEPCDAKFRDQDFAIHALAEVIQPHLEAAGLDRLRETHRETHGLAMANPPENPTFTPRDRAT